MYSGLNPKFLRLGLVEFSRSFFVADVLFFDLSRATLKNLLTATWCWFVLVCTGF